VQLCPANRQNLLNTMIFRFFYCLLLGMCLLPAMAAEPALSFETAYLYDPTEHLQIGDLPAQDMKPYQGDLRLGFRRGAVWIRITTQAGPAATGANDLPPVLRVGPYVLDRVELHEWVEGQWQQQVTGDMQPSAKSATCPDDHHCLRLHSPASKPQTVYVRVQNHSLLFVQTQIVAAQDLTTVVAQRITNLTLSLAMAAGLLLVGVAWLVMDGSRLLLMYCGFQSTVVLFFAASTGLLFPQSPHLTPFTANWILDVLTVTRVAVTILLGWVVMASHRPSQGYKRSIQLLLVFCMVNLLLAMAGMGQLALKLNIAVFALNPLIQLWGVMNCHHLGVTRKRILLLGYTTYVVIFTMGAGTAFGGMDSPLQLSWIAQFSELHLNGMGIGLVFSMLVIYEQRTRQREKQAELDKLRNEAQQAKYSGERLTERRTLIDMLTHELKNPLGTMKFALASLQRNLMQQDAALQRVQHIDDSINRMDALIEHVAKANRIDSSYEVKKAVRVDAQEFLEGIAAEYAHAERFTLHIQAQAWFTADPYLLAVMLENLMQNAYKYGLADKPIQLRVEMTSNGTEFEISNPVAPDRMPDGQHLFDRYYRHENVQDHPGMGIGLSLVQSSAEKMKATISYQQRGMHAVFTVRFNP
jgi:signal transduction histidine kinase